MKKRLTLLAATAAAALVLTGCAGGEGEPGSTTPAEEEGTGQLYEVAKDVNLEGSPTFDAMKIDGDRATLSFKSFGGGLLVNGDKLNGFAIAGEDGKFAWAEAKVENDKIVVWSKDVPKPATVRYGWASNPQCNLFNKEGLPAVPFRTDAPAK